MSLDRLNKMLASSLVSRLIEKGKEPQSEALANLNFKDLEDLYFQTLKEVESSPEIRQDLVESLKKYQQEYGDLNELYSADDIASDPTLQSIMLME